jgi:hypothetical protein
MSHNNNAGYIHSYKPMHHPHPTTAEATKNENNYLRSKDKGKLQT